MSKDTKAKACVRFCTCLCVTEKIKIIVLVVMERALSYSNVYHFIGLNYY